MRVTHNTSLFGLTQALYRYKPLPSFFEVALENHCFHIRHTP